MAYPAVSAGNDLRETKVTPRAPLALSILLAALAVAAPRPAAAAPARYLVFTVGEDGAPRPESAQRVELAAAPRSAPGAGLASALAEDGSGELWRAVLRDAAGAAIFETAATAPRYFRAENGLFGRPGGVEELPAQRSFVLRLPEAPGARLELSPAVGTGAPAGGFTGAASPLYVFEPDALLGDPSLPLAAYSSSLAATRLQPKAGDPGNRFDLLLLGDGYTGAEQGKFEGDAARLLSGFFGLIPYAQYRGFFNTTTLFTPSAQSGADHPPYRAGCGAALFPSCCADGEMLGDPLAGRFVDTAFGATFCAYNIHRLLVVDTARVLTAAAADPDWDRILVLVNDSTYGGSGGALAGAFSMHPDVVELAQHEFGHTFTGLADEYSDAAPSYPDCSDRFGPACEPNVTDETNRAAIKWGPWIEAATPLPTFGGDLGTVGLYEGARYRSSGMYRPQQSCLMNTLGTGFCKVCTEAFILALYRGGWGEPAGGIDYLESLDPAPGAVSLELPGSRVFSAGLLQPLGNTIEAVWRVNGVEAGRGASFTFAPASAGVYELRLETRDATPLVNPAMAGGLLAKSRAWTVTVTGSVAQAPTLLTVSPASGPATGGTRLTLEGSQFTAGAVVRVGGAAASDVSVESPSRITCSAPPGEPGKAAVRVETAAGAAELEDAFTYGSVTPCVPGAQRLCLGGGRFAVEVAWRTAAPASGAGNATVLPASPDSGLFWFFSENNQEMLIKVLDGCEINQRYWVFYAATTNVFFEVAVTDTRKGTVKVYANPLGTPAPPVQDLEAFASCP